MQHFYFNDEVAKFQGLLAVEINMELYNYWLVAILLNACVGRNR